MNKNTNNRHVYYLAFIAAVTLALYWNSLGGDFIWDDRGLIIGNASYLRDWKNLFSAFVNPLFGDIPYYRPLITGWFIIDYLVWGPHPSGFHYTSLILHIVNSLLVYLFILLLFREAKLALCTGLLFAVHPVQSESVAWISGRNDMLLTHFSLISTILYLQRHHLKRLKGVLAYSGCLVSYACALLTKENGVVLPLLFMLIDYFFPERGKSRAKDYCGLWLITLVYFIARASFIGQIGIDVHDRDLVHTFYGIINSYTHYFKMLLFPLFQSAVPTINTSTFSISSFALLLCLSVLAVVCCKRFKEFTFAMLWVTVSLLPVCGIVPLHIPAQEHRLYLGTVCFSMLLPCAVYRFSTLQTQTMKMYTARAVVSLAMPAVLILYSAKTVARNAVWDNEMTFWRTTVEDSPDSAVARNGLGIVYARAGNHQMAIGEFKQGLALHDLQGSGGAGHGNLQRAKIFNNLGQCYYQVLLKELPADKSISRVHAPGRDTIKRLFALSLSSYQKALTINPANHEVRTNLKDLFYLMKNCPPAEEEDQKVSAAGHGRL